MENLKYNERSWAIDIISEINSFVGDRNLTIKRAGGEHGLSGQGNTLFPDTILFGDQIGITAIQGWELKFPDTPISDIELYNNAVEKANRLNLNSFLLWNVSDAQLHLRESEGDSFYVIKNWSIPNIKKRTDVALYEGDWRVLLKEILIFIDDKIKDKQVVSISSSEVLSENIYLSFLSKFNGIQANTVKDECLKNAGLEAQVDVWFKENKQEFKPLDKYNSISRVLIIGWLNRFLFSHYLKIFNNKASIVDSIRGDITVIEALDVFHKITKDCDFMNVFKIDKKFNIVNQDLWRSLISFNGLLVDFQMEKIDQAYFHEILDNALLFSRKKLAGQFSTPPNLADFLTGITIMDRTKHSMDFSCGTGAIAKSIFDLKTAKGITVKDALKTTWASDKFSFPLQLSSIALSDPKGMGEIIRTFKSDAFSLETGKEFEFTDPFLSASIFEKLPEMHSITSNLPYIRFEEVKKLQPNMSEITEDLNDCLTGSFNEGKADIYAYLILKSKELVEDGGRIGIITSNSWLAVDWGIAFKKALFDNFKILKVIISASGRWFDNAAVVSTILVLEKSNTKDDDHKIKFISTKIGINKWDKDVLSQLISNTIVSKKSNELLDINSYSKVDIDNFSIYGIGWSSFFVDMNWFGLISNKLCLISDFFDVARGERRGWDKLFYPASGHGIEEDYIRPVLKSTKSITAGSGLVCEAEDDAFCCDLTIIDLKNIGHLGAVSWIKKFENSTNGSGKALPKILAKPNMLWYQMSRDTQADIVISMNPDRKLCFYKLKVRGFVNQRLIRFTKKEDINIDIHHALLNTAIGMFLLESIGFGRGLGVLDINSSKVSKSMHMLNPDLISTNDQKEILYKFNSLLSRDPCGLEDELLKKDRIEFDELVLDKFNINLSIKDIYDPLLKLYNIRKAVKE